MSNHVKEDLEKYLKEPYSRILIPDAESGTYTAEILELPGCIAQGDTPQEAYERLEEGAKAWIEAALELGQEIPSPSLAHGYGGRVALRLPKSLHRQAAIAAERDGTSLNQFIVTSIAEKVGAYNLYERFTGRMLEVFHQTAPYRVVYLTTASKIQATTSMSLQFPIPEIKSLKEVTDNAGDKKYSIYS